LILMLKVMKKFYRQWQITQENLNWT
jgi:hypothetical protein